MGCEFSLLLPPHIPDTTTVADTALNQIEQMENLPDKFVVPISIGDGLFGIYKGFDDLKKMGLIEKIPQMVSVENCGP